MAICIAAATQHVFVLRCSISYGAMQATFNCTMRKWALGVLPTVDKNVRSYHVTFI